MARRASGALACFLSFDFDPLPPQFVFAPHSSLWGGGKEGERQEREGDSTLEEIKRIDNAR